MIEKWLSDKTKTLLQGFLDRVKNLEEFAHENLIALAREICSEHEVKLVALAQPLRLALTGKIKSPGVFELMEVIPSQEVQKRVERLISQLA